MEPRESTLVGRLREVSGRLGCTPAEAVALGVLLTGACVLLAVLWLLGRPLLASTPQRPVGLATPTSAAGSEPGIALSGEPLVVHVAGRVRAPGLYELDPGARVADALQAAGGARRGAVLEALNLARPLTDGEQLLVPDKAAASVASGAPSAPGAAKTGLISLGQATTEQLEELPGIGPVLAERIIAYRDEVSGFQSVEQLQDVSGIGEKTYAAIADLVSP
ncbi:MAG: helix-hairpin-helix domain-containing protein [Egibacteraceae bacterium]